MSLFSLATSNLDLAAPCLTLGGIWLIARRKRSGWIVASAGSVLWLIIALTASFGGRPIWGQAVLSVVTIGLNGWAWWRWR